MNGQGLKMRVDGLEKKRQELDFYPTTPECVTALLNSGYGPSKLLGPVWEPAVGKGHISHELNKAGFRTIHSDIKDYGEVEDVSVQSFLDCPVLRADQIVTNPPYDIADDFIRHALSLKPAYLALLLKADYFSKKKALSIFNYALPGRVRRPSAIMPLTWRPDFLGQGKPFLTVQWVVWDEDYQSHPITKLLAKP